MNPMAVTSNFNLATIRSKAARLVLHMLSKMSKGKLVLVLPNTHPLVFGDTHSTLLSAQLTVKDWGVFAAILRGGDIAFSEMFMQERISTPDLAAVLKVLAANRHAIDQALYGSWWGSVLDRLLHVLRANTKRQARKNIAAHYDLGNDFYALWLDPSMTYSAALFQDAGQNNIALDAVQLPAAQQAKYQRVVDQLQLKPGSKVLEIGCGWGGFAAHAAKQQHSVVGLTLSAQQLKVAKQRLDEQGLAAHVELKLQDYRDEGRVQQAQYDGVASIEMFEAVGEQYWPSYFDCIQRNLKPGARACVQTIVIRDELFNRYRAGTDFIQRYIFPGGMLPSTQRFVACASTAGLVIEDQFSMGLDYARTLAVWRTRFMQQLDAVRAQGYPERFIRMWEFYLAYCEAGFISADIDVIQFTLRNPADALPAH